MANTLVADQVLLMYVFVMRRTNEILHLDAAAIRSIVYIYRHFQIYSCGFSIQYIIFALLPHAPFPVVTQIRGNVAGTPPLSPLRHMSCIFIGRRVKDLLPSPRLASNLAYPR